ncbi:MAG TPA: hypothetical protein VIE65_18715 [Methylobacter sp.]|jgi:hypothetical protein
MRMQPALYRVKNGMRMRGMHNVPAPGSWRSSIIGKSRRSSSTSSITLATFFGEHIHLQLHMVAYSVSLDHGILTDQNHRTGNQRS